jgi:starvation-inducible DNA-binding protein
VNKVRSLEARHKAPPALDTPTDLSPNAVGDLSAALNAILADTYALYLKTKNFLKTTDEIAERVRKIGGTTLRSIGQIARLQRIKDNDAEFVSPVDMLRELTADNKLVVAHMREVHKLADEHEDVATASLLEVFIDSAEKRTWFLFEASRAAERTGH